MATLNTLRTKGGVIVTVVIGLALLAFLLGDLTSAEGMLRARQNRVGEINGTPIGYMEYAEEVERMTLVQQMMQGKDALSTEETEQVREMAWENLIDRHSLAPGFRAAGIEVSEAEQVDMVSGIFLSPVVTNNFVNPNTGIFEPELLRNFVANISSDASGRLSTIWQFLRDQMIRQRKMAKYMELVLRGIYVTGFEAEKMAELAGTSSSITFLKRDYSEIADSLVKIGQEEVREFYKNHKRLFRQTASRDIEYVVFDILPSEQDYDDAHEYITSLAAEFEASETPFQFATLNSQTRPNPAFQSEDQLPPALAGFAFAGDGQRMFGPVLEGDTYTLARVAETRMLPDSIGARHILVAANDVALADSLEKVLKAGADFGRLAREYSLDEQANLRDGDLGVFPPEVMIPEFSDAALAVNRGQFFRVTTPFGIHIGQLTYKSPLVKKVQLAVITYKVDPSEATQQAVYANVSKFLTAAAGSQENFQKAVTDNALAKRVVRIQSSEREIAGLPHSQSVVRWAFEAKKGDVSPVLEVDGSYVIAVLDAVSQDGYAPISEVSVQIAERLRQQKKGRMLADSLSVFSSLATAAAETNAELQTAENVTFNGFYIEGLGVEPAINGAVTAVQQGKLSRPVIGMGGVYLFEVNSRTDIPTTTAESERVRLQATAESYVSPRVSQALLDASEIVDKRVRFF